MSANATAAEHERQRERALALVITEAALLDAARWQAWLALFAPDARYWVPLTSDQTDPVLQQSLAYEDPLLLSIRVERMSHPRAWSLYPAPRAVHVLQAPIYLGLDPASGLHQVDTAFGYTEVRGQREIQLSGRMRHRIRLGPIDAQIVLKRIDLINADAALPSIYLPL